MSSDNVNTSVTIRLLRRFRIDRCHGMTADGSTQLVVLVLNCKDSPEIAAAMSKADAMVIAHQLMAAANDAQAVQG